MRIRPETRIVSDRKIKYSKERTGSFSRHATCFWLSGLLSYSAPAATMFQELKFQLSTAILTILTLAAGVAAFINFEQQNKFRLADDGVIWVDRHNAVEALYIKPGSPGLNA